MKKIDYKWIVLALLSSAFFFHQADRALFGLLTIPIQNELNLSDLQIGWINTVLSWTLAGMAFIAGPIGDRFSRKWIITISLMAWSLMTIIMGFVGDWHILGIFIPAYFVVMFFRSIATGVGESFFGPCYPPILASYHKETRSLAFSIQQGSLYVGLMTSGILTAYLLSHVSTWRHVFMIFGAAGFLLGFAFIFVLKDSPANTSALSKKGDANEEKRPFLAGFRYFFKTPTALCAMIGFVVIVFVNNAYLFWAPKFMSVKFGTPVGVAGSQTMLYHHLFAFVAILIGGAVTDRFVRRMPRFRIGFQIFALLAGAPCLFFLGMAPTAAGMIALSAGYGLFRGCFEVNTHTSLFDVIPPHYRSTSVGLFTVFAFFVGGLSGILMGWLSQQYGVRGFEMGFALMATAYVVGAAVLAIAFFATFHRDRIKE